MGHNLYEVPAETGEWYRGRRLNRRSSYWATPANTMGLYRAVQKYGYASLDDMPDEEYYNTAENMAIAKYRQAMHASPYRPMGCSYKQMTIRIANPANPILNEIQYSNIQDVSASFSGGILVNGVPQGVTENGRVGNTTICHSIYITFDVEYKALLSNDYPCVNVRAMLIYDKQTNCTEPTIANILASNGSSPTLMYTDFNSPVNDSQRDRFMKMLDYQRTIDQNSAWSVKFKLYLAPDRAGQSTTYTGIDAMFANVTTGGFYLLVFMDKNQIAPKTPVYITNSEITYRFTE